MGKPTGPFLWKAKSYNSSHFHLYTLHALCYVLVAKWPVFHLIDHSKIVKCDIFIFSCAFTAVWATCIVANLVQPLWPNIPCSTCSFCDFATTIFEAVSRWSAAIRVKVRLSGVWAGSCGVGWSRVESEWSQQLQQLFQPAAAPVSLTHLRCLSPVSRQLASCGKGNKLDASYEDRE